MLGLIASSQEVCKKLFTQLNLCAIPVEMVEPVLFLYSLGHRFNLLLLNLRKFRLMLPDMLEKELILLLVLDSAI